MSPETRDRLAEGVARHFGLETNQLSYFKTSIGARRGADGYAANLLTQLAPGDWNAVQEKTLLLSRLMVHLYNSVGEANLAG